MPIDQMIKPANKFVSRPERHLLHAFTTQFINRTKGLQKILYFKLRAES
jgi:hypothetical protein